MSEGKKRIRWIDCAKAIAITAVVVDHCKGILYNNSNLVQASYFSVTLFVLLGGLSAQVSSRGRNLKSIGSQIKKIGNFFMEYMLATLILYCLYQQRFDFKEYISHVVNFSIQGPFYFLLFYFQLLLISPFLISWSRYCESKRNVIIWHIVTIVILGVSASIFINYTFILPVHGGGKYLFGGTYLLVYYVGIIFGCLKIFETRNFLMTFIISLLGWFIWWRLKCINVLPFDRWLQAYWGEGFNPPSINLMVFGILTCFVCFSLFSLLERLENRTINQLLHILEIIGKNTLYIFMYHLLVRDLIVKFCPNIGRYNILAIIAIILIIIVPVMVVRYIKRFKKKYDDSMKEIKRNIYLE